MSFAFVRRRLRLAKREDAVTKGKERLDADVAEKIRQERAKIVAEEAWKAKLDAANDRPRLSASHRRRSC
jgi:hypothetical protein